MRNIPTQDGENPNKKGAFEDIRFSDLIAKKGSPHRSELLNKTINQMKKDPQSTGALFRIGKQVYRGTHHNADLKIFADCLLDTINGSFHNIDSSQFTNLDKKKLFDRYLDSNGINHSEWQQQMAAQFMMIDKQKVQVKQSIQRWYDVGVGTNMDNATINAHIDGLSGHALSRALGSTPHLTSLLRQWHKDHVGESGELDLAAKKIEQIKNIAEKAGLDADDPNIERIVEHIENHREIPLDNLTPLLRKSHELDFHAQKELFILLKPTISLKEYLNINRNGNEKIAQCLADEYAGTGGFGDPATVPATDISARKQEFVERFSRLIKNSNTSSITLSSEYFINMHLASGDAERLFGEHFKKQLHILKDPDSLDDLEHGANADEIIEKLHTVEKNPDALQTLINFEENILRPQDKNIEDINKEYTLEEATKEHQTETYSRSRESIIKKFDELGIANFDQFKEVLKYNGTLPINHNDSVFLVFNAGGQDRYIEIVGYDDATGEISWLSHTSSDGGYSEVGDGTLMKTPIDTILDGIRNKATVITKEGNSLFNKVDIPKQKKGSFFRKIDIDQFLQSQKIKLGTTRENMSRQDLETKLKSIDNKTIAIQPGLLIKTVAVNKEGKKTGSMLIEVKGVNENEKTIDVNVLLSPTGAEQIVTLSFGDFLDQFAMTDSVRLGYGRNIQECVTLLGSNATGDLKNLHKDTNEAKFGYKNIADKTEFKVSGFRSGGEPPDHIVITEQTDSTISYYYVVEGKLDDQGRLSSKSEDSKKIFKRENVSYQFLLHELLNKQGGSWSAQKEDEAKDKHNKDAAHDHHDEHHHTHDLHTHGGPLQWLAHGKNFGHFFKGIGMIFDDIKHFVEHGDEHVAGEMKYKVLTWMEKQGGLIGKMMPPEVYLDMKSEIEAKISEAINKYKDKWSKLSTANVGKMAVALLADKYTTNEQMFGIIMALHGKTGTLYGVPDVQKYRAEYHNDKLNYTPYPCFLFRLCQINKHNPEVIIPELVKLASPGGTSAYEGGTKPIPEMYLISLYSQIYLQKEVKPPPVPGSYHAKLHQAWRTGEQEQKKAANEGEANMYSTQDQIEKRMYMLAADGEVAQAVGFYERLIPRGAPTKTLLGLPFILATTELRGYMSTQLNRGVHIDGVYEQGFTSSIYTALESQQKYDTFQSFLKKLAAHEYIVSGEPVLTEQERKELGDIFDAKKGILMKDGKPESSLKCSVEKARKFWQKHGEKMMRLFNVTDENLALLQLSEEIPEAKAHLQNTIERTEGKSFDAKPLAYKNEQYDINTGSYNVTNPREAANSFAQGVNPHTGKFKSDETGQMHEHIFMLFRPAFMRLKNIENESVRKDKFFEMLFEIIRKITNTFEPQLLRQILNGAVTPNWLTMLKNTVGFDMARWANDEEMNQYLNAQDPNFRSKALVEYEHLMRGNTREQVGKIINPFTDDRPDHIYYNGGGANMPLHPGNTQSANATVH